MPLILECRYRVACRLISSDVPGRNLREVRLFYFLGSFLWNFVLLSTTLNVMRKFVARIHRATSTILPHHKNHDFLSPSLMLPRGITRTILDIRIWLLWSDEPSPFSLAHRIISHLPLLFIYVIFNLTSFYFLCLKLCISPLANSKLEYSEDFLFQINPRAKFSIKNGGKWGYCFSQGCTSKL